MVSLSHRMTMLRHLGKQAAQVDANPYAPGSIAHHVWAQTRAVFERDGRGEAMRLAQDHDRNLNLGLAKQVRAWTE
jgi:hypothetical protein